MPPCLDVYALSGERNLEMIDRFVGTFTRSELDEPCEYDLHVVPADYDGSQELRRSEDYDVIPVGSLRAAIQYGVEEPGRAFTVYFSPVGGWCGAVMAFTLSGEVVFGLSVHDQSDGPSPPIRWFEPSTWRSRPRCDEYEDEPLKDARELMVRLAQLTEARRSWIGVEETPTLDPDREEPWSSPLARELAPPGHPQDTPG